MLLSSGTPLPLSVTAEIVAQYNELDALQPKMALQSLFKTQTIQSLYPVIEVRRGTEKIASPVPMGHQGNWNEITKSTVKAFEPFYFREKIDLAQIGMGIYYRQFGSSSFNANERAQYVNSVVSQTLAVKNKIVRAIEYSCSWILKAGTAKAITGEIIDFGRKSGSMVDLGSGNYWTTTTNNPYTSIETGCNWLRTVGKAMDNYFDVIMGTEAYAAFILTDEYKERQKYFNLSPDMMNPNLTMKDGLLYKGLIDVNTHKVRVYTYNEFYEDASGNMQKMFDGKDVVILPTNPDFVLQYCAVPQVVPIGTNTSSLNAQPFVYSDYVNAEAKTHNMYIESRPIPIPVAVDQIYTMKVIGG